MKNNTKLIIAEILRITVEETVKRTRYGGGKGEDIIAEDTRIGGIPIDEYEFDDDDIQEAFFELLEINKNFDNPLKLDNVETK